MKSLSHMKSRANKRARQAGMTLIEIMVVLALIGVVIGAVVYYQSRANATQTATEMSKSIATIASKVKSYYRPSNSYVALTSANLNNMALIASPMSYNTTSGLLDPWGNVMTVTGGTTTFALSVGGTTNPLDKEVCTNLATTLNAAATVIRIGGTTTPVTMNTSGATQGTVTGGNLYKGGTTVADASALATGCTDTSPVIGMQFQ